MAYVREHLDEEYLKTVKNITPVISRRISHLVSLQNIVYEKQTKSRTVLVKGRYKYVDNIIEFPTVNKAENDNKSLDATHNIIEDMQKQKASDMSNYLAESILMAVLKRW